MISVVSNPRALATMITLIVVAGLASSNTIVRQEDPTITNGVGVIVTPLPGASAERVEALVTEKIEDELRELSEIQTLSSVSRNSVSLVVVELDERLQGEATEKAFSKIRDALDDARRRFPPEAGAPDLDTQRFGSYTRIIALRWTAEGEPRLGLLARYAAELEARLRDVPGTEHVKVFGEPEEEITVDVDPAELDAAGLTVGRVASAIAGADAKVSAGVLRGERREATIEVAGEIDGLSRIREVPLSAPGAAGTLRVGDVARVRRGVRSPASTLAFVEGAPAVVVAAKVDAGVKFDVWRDRAQRVVDAFESRLPKGIESTLVFDQTVYTEARLGDLLRNLATGLALVVSVLFITLGWRSALMVTMTLPLVSCICLTVLNFMEVPIHQMSVTGLIVALGLLVDAAIVVVDAIGYRLDRGMSPADAVRDVVRTFWAPLASSTLTTVLAFMPILLLSGRVGEFVGTIGLSVVVALIASYFVAMTIIPQVSRRFLQPRATGAMASGIRLPRLGRWFRASVRWSVNHPRLSMGLVTLVPLLGFWGASTLPSQFFPPADRNQFHVQLRMAPGTSIAHTERAARMADAVLRRHPEVEQTAWFVGQSAPPFYYNLKQNQDGNPTYAQALVRVDSVAAVGRLLPPLQRELDREVPEAKIVLQELLQGPPVDAPIEVRVYGPELPVLDEIGRQVRLRMSRVPAVTHTLTTLRSGSPQIWLQANEDEAQLAGLGLTDVIQQVGAHLEGVTGGSLLEGPEELPVRVRAPNHVRRDIDAIASLSVLSPQGDAVPLESIARVDMRSSMAGIPHRGGARVNVVRGWIHAGVFPDTAFGAFTSILADDPLELPPGYRVEIGGDAEERGDAMANLFSFVPLLVFGMLACVAVTLDSFRLGGIVFVVAGHAMGLGLLSLTIARHPLGFQGMIGLIGLIGVAINAAIIICAALREDPDAVAGDPDTVANVVTEETSRHIISTTITTFGGFLPLILSPGGFWPPFATGIAGGVLLSALLSFYFVPAAFIWVTRRRPVREFSGAQEAAR